MGINGIYNSKENLKRTGFTLVELLAAIVIIGILSFFAVTGVTRYIRQSKEVKNEENVKNIKMAAQMYMQANRSSLPKNIGESIILDVRTLRDTNYLKEDITNSKGESCMQSNVRVYHYDRDEYSYYVRLACGDKPSPSNNDKVSPPKISIRFYNYDKDNAEEQKNNVNDIYFDATICGDESCKGSLGIYSYSYEIYAIYGDESNDKQLVFNSGNLKGGLQSQIKIESKRVSEYVDFTGFSQLSVTITATNEQGDSHTETVNSGGYKDKLKPICSMGFDDAKHQIASSYYPGEATSDNDWLNKHAYSSYLKNGDYQSTYRTDDINKLQTISFNNSKRSFKITAYCEDGYGSGCARDSFVRTWPNGDEGKNTQIKYQYGARWSKITIKDNANNTQDCFVRANVDLKAPSLKVYVYKVINNRRTLIKELSKNFNNNNIDDDGKGDNVTISCANKDDKKNCPSNLAVSSTGELWMNAENYPGGSLEIDVDMEDNLYLHDYTWELNDPYIGSGKSVGDPTLKNAKDEQGNSDIVQKVFAENNSNERISGLEGNNIEHSRLTANVTGLKINREGKRYGKFTACDKAGNCTTVNFYFNIDITAPPVPDPKYVLKGTSTSYYPDEKCGSISPNDNWTNKSVVAYIPKSYVRDDLTNSSRTAELSGHDKINYFYYEQNRNGSSCSASTLKSSGALSKNVTNNYAYSYLISNEGNQHIIYTSCDNAGNCSKESSLEYVKIDKTAPTCKTTASTSNWTNKKVTVTGECIGDSKIYESGCEEDSRGKKVIQQSFHSNMNRDVGPGSGGSNGYVSDKAGNTESCKKVRVKIDVTAPKCSYSHKNTDCVTVCGKWRCRRVCYSVKYTFSCSDARNSDGTSSGCSSKPKPQIFDKSGSYYRFYPGDYYVKDAAGNKGYCDGTVDEFYIESEPTGYCSIDSNGTIHVENTKDEASFGGVRSIKYSINGGAYTTDNHINLPKCISGGESNYYKVVAKITSSTGKVSSDIVCDRTFSLEDCCSSYRSDTSDCSAPCGGGTATVNKYSNYDGRFCGTEQISCNTGSCGPVGNNCDVRGTRVIYPGYSWQCTAGHTHTDAYVHYCWDGSQYVTRDQNPSLNTFRFVCTLRPYTEAQGWTIIPD